MKVNTGKFNNFLVDFDGKEMKYKLEYEILKEISKN